MATCRANAECQTTEKNDRDKEAAARIRDDMKYMLAAVSAGSKDAIPKHMKTTRNPEQDAIVAVQVACRTAARGQGIHKARELQQKECMAIASYGEHALNKYASIQTWSI